MEACSVCSWALELLRPGCTVPASAACGQAVTAGCVECSCDSDRRGAKGVHYFVTYQPGVAATVLPAGPSRWEETEGPWLLSLDQQLCTCIERFQYIMVRAFLRRSRSLRMAAKLLGPKIAHSWSPSPQQHCSASANHSSSTYTLY